MEKEVKVSNVCLTVIQNSDSWIVAVHADTALRFYLRKTEKFLLRS